jgi:hypothetical protein
MFVLRCVQPASALPNTQTHDGSVVNLQVCALCNLCDPIIVSLSPLDDISDHNASRAAHAAAVSRSGRVELGELHECGRRAEPV